VEHHLGFQHVLVALSQEADVVGPGGRKADADVIAIGAGRKGVARGDDISRAAAAAGCSTA
jgi:hypothetical protein